MGDDDTNRNSGPRPYSDESTHESLTDDRVDEDATLTSPSASQPSAPSALGEIGEFHLLRQIGAGGMGVVYEAEQQDPKRHVALKVIRGDRFVDDTYVRLFRREAQALALLKHPAIAAIHEAGHTKAGEHYFAMELVHGETLDQWLAGRRTDRGLSREELGLRLRVFQKICAGVAYAHQRGVVHRDLKPSNILITHEGSSSGMAEDPTPAVKILDFGLARITNADVAATIMETDIGAIRGTYSYMSPEQIRGLTETIDTRSDLYSLGVVLYEMLAGELPYAVSGRALHEISRVICEEPPTPLRTKWQGQDRPDPDIETIILKALEKDPERRYQSVSTLNDDLTRFLQRQPILARPPSTIYQLRKMLQRHTLPFVSGIAAVVVLVAGVVALSVQQSIIADERDRANDEARTAEATNDYLVNLFEITDPSETRGRNITASELLQRGKERLEGSLQEQPVVRARVTDAIGRVYMNLGLYDEAHDALEESYELLESIYPGDSIYKAHALNALAAVNLYRGAYDESERMFREALAMRRRLLPADSRDVAESLNNLGTFLMRKGEIEEARDLIAEALEARRGLAGAPDEELASMMSNLAYCEQALGHRDKAERLNREVLALRRQVLGDDHPSIAISLNNLGMDLYRGGRNHEAEELVREAVALNLKIYGPTHPQTAATKSALVTILSGSGEIPEAQALMQEVIAADEASFGSNHPRMAEDLIKLASIEEEGGDLASSETHYRRALRIQRDAFPEESWQVATTKNLLGGCLTGQKRYEEAEPLLAESFEVISESFGDDHPRTAAARRRVIANFEGWGRPDLAEPYRPPEDVSSSRG